MPTTASSYVSCIYILIIWNFFLFNF
jgi:hypothetical protein